jgi:predicted ABC-type transport system involved in lysophospholipase L1 biosynthesis ATPase subunit
VEDLLVRLRETRGIAVVAVTHNPSFAARMDRQIHMVDGRLVEAENPGLPSNTNGT